MSSRVSFLVESALRSWMLVGDGKIKLAKFVTIIAVKTA